MLALASNISPRQVKRPVAAKLGAIDGQAKDSSTLESSSLMRRDRSVTVIVMASRRPADAPSVGVARRSGVVDVEQMVSAALTDARGAPPADDAFTLVDGMDAARGWGRAASLAFGRSPVETDLSVLGNVLSGLSSAFARAAAQDVVLAGFAEYGVSTLYLGSSTGVRLLTTLLHEMEDDDRELGLVTMCCGGGLGTATVLQLV